MFRRIILTALLGIGLTSGLALTPGAADAHPPVERFHHRHEVVVVKHEREYHHCGEDAMWAHDGRHCGRHEKLVEIRRR